MLHERRLHQRLSPASPQLVLLDESKYTLMLDVSEGGLSVEGAAIECSDRNVSIQFDMPDKVCSIQAKAQNTWTSASGYRTGFCFVDLPAASRQHLRACITAARVAGMDPLESQVSTTSLGADTPATGVSVADVANRQAQAPSQDSLFRLQSQFNSSFEGGFAGEEPSPETSALRPVSLIATALSMSALAFVLGYYWRSGLRPQPKPVAAVSGTSELVSAGPAAAPQPPPDPSIPPRFALDNSGFVLQVGAMGKETNADALSNDLQKKNFSAFVYHRDGDRFYRVAVGPYTDQQAAIRIRADLKQEGYTSILRTWTPQ
jgi:septal ring-binding cell division protein DamX